VKTSQDIQSESFQKSKLRKWFAPLELDMIEAAFEKVVICDTARKLQVMLPSFKTKPTKLGKKCILFGRQFKTPKERMLAILENILVNKTFTP